MFRDSVSTPPPSPDLTHPAKYLGAATTILIAAELFRDRSLSKGEYPLLGALSDLYPYILRRWGVDSAAQLPDIPVPEHFQCLFLAWAAKKINFVHYSEDPSHGRATGNALR
jgi:hypothetical protein